MEEPQLRAQKYVLEIQIPGLPLTYNQCGYQSHWVRLKNAQAWKAKVAAAVGRYVPFKPLTRARVTITRGSFKDGDYDGQVQAAKPLLDGLVACGVLSDDSKKIIGIPTYLWEKAERNKGYVKIRVEEVQ